MKVKDLITRLQSVNQEADVDIECDGILYTGEPWIIAQSANCKAVVIQAEAYEPEGYEDRIEDQS